MPNRFPREDRLPAFETDEAKRVAEALGPMPRETLIAMVDYGLCDAEISRYFRLGPETVSALRQHFTDDR